jgi:Tol biopolymer transport system component
VTALPSGHRLGPYDIVAPLGAGGMGEVYRARDTRLGRDVAVKALPAAAVADPERISRFRREAQILAGLTHPHIATLYGLEEAGDSQFLVMELVEGGTLATRLASGPLAVRDALTIARQIADALQAAHDRGIIHRDLKPANIAFTAEGHSKVLDFGLAKALVAGGNAATVAADATKSGVVLGTVAYMSPEQARGQPLDKRTDIFSFGCVFYEMLTARNPFARSTLSDTVVAILGSEPDWTLLPSQTPERVRWLLRRCLEKDPRRRLHDIADARIELDEALTAGTGSGAMPAAAAASMRWSRMREAAAWTAAAVLLLTLGMLYWRREAPDPSAADERVVSAAIPLPNLATAAAPEQVTRFAVSPDGRRIAYVGNAPGGGTMLWVRPLDTAVAQPIAGTEGGIYPFWSPDSRQLGFIWRPTAEISVLSGQLKRVSLDGGAPVTLADLSFSSLSAWNHEGVILFTPAGNAPLHQVSSSSGADSTAATTLDTAAGHVQHAQPSFLPDGRHFLYAAVGSLQGGATTPTGIYVGRLGEPSFAKLLVENASQPAYAGGRLLFVRSGTLLAQPFDATRLALEGTPVPIMERVLTSASGGGIGGAYSVSNDVLVYQTTAAVGSQLAWFDRRGTEVGRLGEQADWVDVALSPDGTRAASSRADPVLGTRDIWTFDVKRGIGERFTWGPTDDFAPVWGPGGRRLIFSSLREGRVDLYEKSQTTGPERRIADEGLALGKFAADWSPDGESVLFIAGGRTIARSDIMLLPARGGAARAFVETSLVETQARFSGDGRWIAYAANVSGRLEVYVKPHGRAGEPRQVSANGGSWPQWRRDNAEIVFVAPDETFMAAQVRVNGDELAVGDIRPLFKTRLRTRIRLDAYPYDMTPDGQQFLVNALIEENLATPLSVILNWGHLLRP